MKIWIEMNSKMNTHHGDWSFTKSVWAPTYKQGVGENKSWLYWDNVSKVKSGDLILHLGGRGKNANLIGYSIAETDGYKTSESPPFHNEWSYCESYYRAFLKEFTRFSKPINLYHLFSEREQFFIEYYEQKTKPKNLFYTIQSGRLQCLNGAYLSEVDETLISILFGEIIRSDASPVETSVSTSVVIREIKTRVGHEQFALNVKKNYSSKCCFPECQITDSDFLVASHIARWSDNEEKRGNISNGLCLCLIHDKAFELGYFSLDNDLKVCISNKECGEVFMSYILPYEHRTISVGSIEPDREALKEHRLRCNIL